MKVLFSVFVSVVLCLVVGLWMSAKEHRITATVKAPLESIIEVQKERIDVLIEVNELWAASNKVLVSEKIEAEKQYFMISHFPFPGEPWTIEKYWAREELWIALQSYSSRIAAEDIKAQLESGELKTRDLFR